MISNILLNEVLRENNKEYKIKILEEFLLEDEKLFIQAIQLLKFILNDFVSSDVDYFQSSLDNLSNDQLKNLEGKIQNDWIKETLIYTFEQISLIYIETLIANNEKSKEENKQNILIYLDSFLNNCLDFLEKLYKDPNLKNKENQVNLRKVFALSFTRVYLKIFVDWIDEGKFSKYSDINEIINIIKGNEENKFRNMLAYFICKILYNKKQDIKIFFDNVIVNKFHLDSFPIFEEIKNEKNNNESAKFIVFVDATKTTDEDLTLFTNEFNLLTKSIEVSGDKENELKRYIEENNRIDIFFSVFSAKISSHLSNTGDNKDKINLLSKIVHKIFSDKEKLLNILDLFLDKSKYTKQDINSYTAEILQYSLKYCILSDEISDDDNNMYYPLYSGDKNINCFIPGNDIKKSNIYDCYSNIKKILNENPSNHGVYICICNKDKENEIINTELIKGNGYPDKSGKCKYCGQPTGNDGEPNSFYERDSYYRIFKNQEDLKKETEHKKNGICMTLDDFYKEYISEKLEDDSKGINISQRSHFNKSDKPIRNQSQIGYRLMNLILYSHLFTDVLFKNEEEIFKSDDGLTYLDYIKGNWNKLKKLLEDKGINIYIFMNLIFKDLFNYLNKQSRIDNYEKLLEIEKEIEKIIDSKIVKKTENIKGKELTKYSVFAHFYNKIKEKFREMDPKSKLSLIKEVNPPDNYNEEEYPYYKSFLYSDYPNEKFLESRLEELNKEKYPVINLYLNRKKNKKGINKKFIIFNLVVKSLLNENSNKISKNDAKKLTLEKTNFYKENSKRCEEFIKIMQEKNNDLSKESSLDNFLIHRTEKGKLLIDMYEKYAKAENDSLNEILIYINAINNDGFTYEEINIQEAQRSDLFILEFDNKSKFTEILLSNTFREIFMPKSKIKYNNYNLFSIDFEKIEKIFEDVFIRNACILKTDEIAEMRYTGEEFLNDGIYELDKKIKPVKLNDNEKKAFVNFYEKNLKENLDLCLNVQTGFKTIITYIKKNENINTSKGIYRVITEGTFPSEICPELKNFLKDNENISINKLTDLTIYFERLYFELAIKKKGDNFKQILNDKIKEDIKNYYKEGGGLFLTKKELSIPIIRFILIDIMSQTLNKARLFEINDNLFDLLSSKYLWEESFTKDNKFTKEIEEYKKLGVLVSNTYDFYKYIATDSIKQFEEEIQDILKKINNEEKSKLVEERLKEREEKRKEIDNIQITQKTEDVKLTDINDDEDDIDEMTDF